MRYVSAALAAVIIIMSLTLTAGSIQPPYVGEWALDGEKNSLIAGDLYTMFGSSLRQFGAKLTVEPDGDINYYLGLFGGAGTYSAADGVIIADIVSYNDPHHYTAVFYTLKENGRDYIVYRFNDGVFNREIWWKKADK